MNYQFPNEYVDYCKNPDTNKNHTLIVVTDNKSTKITFSNTDESDYKKIRIDNYVIKNKYGNNQQSADYLLQKVGVGQIIIELKGTDFVKAANQLVTTYQYLKDKTEYNNKTRVLVVVTKHPKAGYAQANKIIKKNKLGILHSKNNNKIVRFEDLSDA